MKRGFRSFLVLLGVFCGTFAAVFFIRNGPSGVLRALGAADKNSNGYRPEAYTLPERAPLDFDDVEVLSRLDEEYATLTDAVVKSVVSINTNGVQAQRFFDWSGRQFVRPVPTKGQGSGVIVTKEGHVVTNHHVIENQQEIKVTLHNGETYGARLIGSDPLLDIAVLKIEGATDLTPLRLGDSTGVRRGQIAFAIGNPFGLGETITQGIISAVDRSVSDTQRDLLQTDAAINPGNSGGPLVNIRGEVIGINSAIYRPDDRVNAGFQGVGFAIPSNDVMTALQTILERGQPIYGYLGVRRVDDLDRALRYSLGYDGEGAVIRSVIENSPADLAGLKPLDVVVSYNGEKVENVTTLLNMVRRSKVGKPVPVEIWRQGKKQTLDVTIGEANVTPPAPAEVPGEDEVWQKVGITPSSADVSQGIIVEKIAPGSLAEGHLLPGDRIVQINGSAVGTLDHFRQELASSVAAQATALTIIRGNRRGQVRLPRLSR
ncbi:trypsin-like peptidase domain-containing protein [Haloferula sargassicola]|uniref:PDZ domain-containing protein n=1 Tax=Haloferula sargassicola TaxID=490096 RepID=A0ABP9UMZ5_9BACT